VRGEGRGRRVSWTHWLYTPCPKANKIQVFYGLKLVQEVTLGGLSWARDFLGLGHSVNVVIIKVA